MGEPEKQQKPPPSAAQEQTEDKTSEYNWLIRPCLFYEDEYGECTSIRGRFHQYFIFGEPTDCGRWKRDYENCKKWTKKNDLKAKEALIESEKQRRLERLKAHYMNDVWEKRKEPPEDWNKPLPAWMVERDENTYLSAKSKEMKGGDPVAVDKYCTIM